MKVLVIAHDLGRLGAQMVLLHLLRQLRQQQPLWDLRLLVRAGDGDLLPDFQAVLPVTLFWKSSLEAPGLDESHLEKKRELQAWTPDVIYANTSINGDVLTFLDLPIPLLVHAHEMSYYLERLDPARLAAFKTQPTHYLAVSQAARSVLEKHFSIPGEKISVLYESLDLERIDRLAAHANRSQTRARLGIPENALLVGCVGRIDERKGWDLFAQAALELLQKSDPARPWHFLWLGHGPNLPDLESAFAIAGHSDALATPGPWENPFPAYAAMDFYLQTSREDPCPLSVLEAAYSARPVLVFGPSGGAKEVVERGCGIAIEDFDPLKMAAALQNLSSSPNQYQALATAGPQIIRDHHNSQIAAATLAKHLIATASL